MSTVHSVTVYDGRRAAAHSIISKSPKAYKRTSDLWPVLTVRPLDALSDLSGVVPTPAKLPPRANLCKEASIIYTLASGRAYLSQAYRPPQSTSFVTDFLVDISKSQSMQYTLCPMLSLPHPCCRKARTSTSPTSPSSNISPTASIWEGILLLETYHARRSCFPRCL